MINFKDQYGPSTTVSCQLSAAIVGEECVRILSPDQVFALPHFRQFDPYTGEFESSKLRMGNRHPFQRVKRWHLQRLAKRLLKPQQTTEQ